MEFFAATADDVKGAIEGQLPNQNFGQSNVTNILTTVYAFVGIIAVGFIIYGAVQYVISNGDPGKITKAKNTILYSVIGLVVVLLAAALTFFLTQVLAGQDPEAGATASILGGVYAA